MTSAVQLLPVGLPSRARTAFRTTESKKNSRVERPFALAEQVSYVVVPLCDTWPASPFADRSEPVELVDLHQPHAPWAD